MKWWKSHHGKSRDDRLLAIAVTLKVPPLIVVGLNWDLRGYASQNQDRGSITGYNEAGAGALFRIKPETIRTIIDDMRDFGILAGDRFVDWTAEQETPAKDCSTQRTRNWRGRKRLLQNGKDNIVDFPIDDGRVTAGDDGVTVRPSQCDAESKTPSDAYASSGESKTRAPAPLPANWAPHDADIAYAKSNGMAAADIDREAEAFRNRHLRDESRYSDWHFRWREWVGRWVGLQARNAPTNDTVAKAAAARQHIDDAEAEMMRDRERFAQERRESGRAA